MGRSDQDSEALTDPLPWPIVIEQRPDSSVICAAKLRQNHRGSVERPSEIEVAAELEPQSRCDNPHVAFAAQRRADRRRLARAEGVVDVGQGSLVGKTVPAVEGENQPGAGQTETEPNCQGA